MFGKIFRYAVISIVLSVGSVRVPVAVAQTATCASVGGACINSSACPSGYSPLTTGACSTGQTCCIANCLSLGGTCRLSCQSNEVSISGSCGS